MALADKWFGGWLTAFLCSFLFISLCTTETYAQRAEPVHFLPDTIIYDFLRDKNGILWIGTDSGLIRYDGFRMERYTMADGLPGNEILMLVEGNDSKIWLLDFSGATSYIKNDIIYSYLNSSYFAEITPSTPHLAGHVAADTTWVSWEDGRIGKFTPQGVEFVNLSQAIVYRYIYQSMDGLLTLTGLRKKTTVIEEVETEHEGFNHELSTGRLFYHTGGVYVPSNSVWVRIYSDPSTSDPENYEEEKILDFSPYGLSGMMTSAVHTFDGFVAAGTSDGLYFFDPAKDKKAITALDNVYVTRVISDKEGNIWASTLGSGLYLFPAGYWHIKSTSADILNISTFRNVALLDDGRAFTGTTSNGLLLVDFSGTEPAAVGMDSELFSRLGNQISFIEIRDNWLVAGGVLQIIVARKNADGVYELVHQTEFSAPKGIQFINDHDFIMTGGSGVYRLTYSEAEGVYSEEILYRNRITTAFENEEFGLLIGKNTGLYYMNPTNGELKNIVTNIQITTIKKILNGKLLVGTNGSGLFYLEKADEQILAKPVLNTATLVPTIREIVQQNERFIWLAGSNGIFRLDNHNQNLQLKDTGNIYSADIHENKIVYLSSNKLIERPLTIPAPPEVKLFLNGLRISTDQQLISQDQPLRFPYNQGQISFYATAPYFRNIGTTEYLYMLRPADQSWIKNAGPEIIFRNLRPGQYQLYLRAGSSDDVIESDDLIISFVIVPPFWQQPWFLVISFLLLGLVISAGVRIRIKKIRHLEQERLAQYRQLVELEQQALNAMMNPHFIFNVLNSIRHYMSGSKIEEAELYLQMFARLIRLQLESSYRKYISLKDESERLKTYAGLEQLRLNQAFSFHISFCAQSMEEAEDIELPPMLLQPFIENAIKHGIEPESGYSNADRSIHTSFELLNQHQLEINIVDNGTGIHSSLEVSNLSDFIRIYTSESSFDGNPEKHGHQSLAMRIIAQRLELLAQEHGVAADLSIRKAKNGSGTAVRLVLPV
ncbi:MAG: histidine kinase [Balneolales bacterium]|nr:histidine kinase [Balneolales bacterium]